MKKLTASDILPNSLYEPVRDDMRRRVVDVKRARRIGVGPEVTVVFENRATMIFQVQEMLRAERITQPDKVREEIEVYNELLPGPGELAATMFVEITDPERIRPTLHRLVGIDEHVFLHVGTERVQARFEAGRSDEERISSVQYLRFHLSPDVQQALRTSGTALALEVDHPHYEHRIALSEDTRQSLASDLD